MDGPAPSEGLLRIASTLDHDADVCARAADVEVGHVRLPVSICTSNRTNGKTAHSSLLETAEPSHATAAPTRPGYLMGGLGVSFAFLTARFSFSDLPDFLL